MTSGEKLRIRCIGFLFVERQQLEDSGDYFDFTSKIWTGMELESDLTLGVLPLGLIVEPQGRLPGVVVPDPEGGQMVRPLAEVLKQAWYERVEPWRVG